jgi:thioredoxin reductase
MTYDVIIAGGGPTGLAAALTLGRGRKSVLLCDSGPPRNAAAVHVQNFVTRDGTPPPEFRRIAREQLLRYPNVEIRDTRVHAIRGERGAFEARLDDGTVRARRVLLCTGMMDELPDIEGFRERWGRSIFACPYCHGWEVQDRRFACLATSDELLTFAIFLRGWTRDVTVLTNGALSISDDMRERLASAGVRVDERPIERLAGHDGELRRVQFTDGHAIDVDVLFAHPAQRQVDLVRSLNVALDEKGYVRVDDTRATSVPGIYAAGDLLSPAQAAVLGAASGMFAAASINRELTVELAARGALD